MLTFASTDNEALVDTSETTADDVSVHLMAKVADDHALLFDVPQSRLIRPLIDEHIFRVFTNLDRAHLFGHVDSSNFLMPVNVIE